MRTPVTACMAALVLAAPVSAQEPRPLPPGEEGEAILYQARNLAGYGILVTRPRPDLRLDWRVGSIEVLGGGWEVCQRPNFQGQCMRVNSSRSNIAAWQGTVQSVRPVDRSGWRAIAQAALDNGAARGSLPLWGISRYSRIRLCFGGRATQVSAVRINFGDGGPPQDIAMDAVVPAGACSGDIAVVRGRGEMASVDLTYAAVPEGATVEVFAR